MSAALLVTLLAIADPAAIVDIRVHGNHSTSDAVVLQVSGVSIGDAYEPAMLDLVSRRLEASGRFRRVQVLQRYASMSDASAVLLVILVEEVTGITIEVDGADARPHLPGPFAKLKAGTMWMPILRWDEGYGFSYGARFSFVDLLGPNVRVSTPFTWGADRRAAVEVERSFHAGPFTRLAASGSVRRREHPVADISDERIETEIRAEKALTTSLRIGALGRIGRETFGGDREDVGAAGVEVAFDTRRDPSFPRNAVYASVRMERLWFGTAADTVRATTDLRGFASLGGSRVLALRAQHVWTADSTPAFEQALLGGASSLRGFRFGYRAGDQLAAGSIEVRLPISSPVRIGRTGVAIFTDVGTAYPDSLPLSRAQFDTGVGAGLFFQAPLFSLRFDVARGIHGAVHGHLNVGIAF